MTDDQLEQVILSHQRALERLSRAGDTAAVVKLMDAAMLHGAHALALLRQHGKGVNFIKNCPIETVLRLRHLVERLKTAFWV